MKLLKKEIHVIVMLVVTALIVSCSTVGNKSGIKYENGYYITEIKYGFDEVYKATVDAIESGETYDVSGNSYDLKVNEKTKNKAVIKAVSSSKSNDYLEVIIDKLSKDVSKLTIKYGNQGDSIRSSSLVSIIDGNIKYS